MESTLSNNLGYGQVYFMRKMQRRRSRSIRDKPNFALPVKKPIDLAIQFREHVTGAISNELEARYKKHSEGRSQCAKLTQVHAMGVKLNQRPQQPHLRH